MTQMELGLELMLYGLVGVFGTLILFYLLIKALCLFSKKKKASDQK